MITVDDFMLNDLCEIIYPELKKRIFSIFEKYQRDQYILFEIPMLFESGFDKFFNFIININSEKELQLKRSLNKKIEKKEDTLKNLTNFNLDMKGAPANKNIVGMKKKK